MTEQITIKRITENIHGMFGVLLKDDIPIMVTLENNWRANIANVSCIPEGIYECEMYNSPHHGISIKINDVPNRTDILIHSGNTHNDTEGCILVGMQYGELYETPAILRSKDAMKLLFDITPNEFILKIIDLV